MILTYHLNTKAICLDKKLKTHTTPTGLGGLFLSQGFGRESKVASSETLFLFSKLHVSHLGSCHFYRLYPNVSSYTYLYLHNINMNLIRNSDHDIFCLTVLLRHNRGLSLFEGQRYYLVNIILHLKAL